MGIGFLARVNESQQWSQSSVIGTSSRGQRQIRALPRTLRGRSARCTCKPSRAVVRVMSATKHRRMGDCMGRRTLWATAMLVGMLVGGCASTGPSIERSAVASVRPSSESSRPVTSPAGVPSEDARLVDDFVAFALDPRASTLQPLPLSPQGVRIGLGEDLIKELVPDAATDPASWRINPARAFRGYVGPFSALQTIRGHAQGEGGDSGLRKSGDMTVSVGPHPHCASPPVPAPSGLADARRVSVQPTDDSITSCLAWFSVDFFLDSNRDIVAVTLDLWEP